MLDALEFDRAVLAGASMGAHTALRFALRRPERVAGLVVVTPAFDGRPSSPERLARWDALAAGLRQGGVDGFVAAYGEPPVQPPGATPCIKVIRQRLGGHEHRDAVADALRAVPRSMPFASLEELRAITAPTTIVASNDEADPEHPFAVGESYADRSSPDAQLVTDEPGRSPVAWQGSQLSRVIAEVAGRGRRRAPATGRVLGDAAAEEAGDQARPPAGADRRAGRTSTSTLGELPEDVVVRRRAQGSFDVWSRSSSSDARSSADWMRSGRRLIPRAGCGSRGPSGRPACRPTSTNASSASSASRPGSWTTKCVRSTPSGQGCGSSTASATGRRRIADQPARHALVACVRRGGAEYELPLKCKRTLRCT